MSDVRLSHKKKINVDLSKRVRVVYPRNHSDLYGLGFDESGHIGFQRELTNDNKLNADLVDDTNSLNKFTNSQEKTKLAGIESGAQANIIEQISVNGVPAQVDANKNVNLVILLEAGVKLTYVGATGVLSLLDEDNNVLSSVDLPLELIVQSGYYDSQNKNIVLVLANQDTIVIPVADILSGVATQDWVNNNYYNKSYSDINYSNLISKTYNELVALKANNGLVVGQFYRITDYVTAVNGKVNNVSDLARATGNQFDLIIQAISTNRFSEKATPILHSGDTYFASENLQAWKVWYSFDNDTNRFEWADTVNGKGVIYRLIDEFNNDVPYDFKNIQFKRYTISAVVDSRQSFMIGLKIGVNGQSSNITSDTSTYDWCYTFSTSDLRDASLRANYIEGASSANTTMAKQNIIGQYLCDSPYYRGVQALNDFVIKSNNSIDNKFGDGSHSNTIYAAGNDVMYNYFGSMFRQNVIALYNINHNDASECFERNVIGKDLTTENSFQWNIFASHFSNSICISVKHSHFTLNSSVSSTKFPNIMQYCEAGTIVNCDFSGCTEMQEVKLYVMSNVTILKRIRYSTIFKIINSTINSNIMYSNISFIGKSTILCDLTVVNIEYMNYCNITLSSIQFSKLLLQSTTINDSTITLRTIDARILLQNDTSITLPQTTLVGGKIYDNVAHTILLFENKVFDDTTHTMTNVSLYSTDNGTTWLEANDSSFTITDAEWTDLREGL